MKMPTIRPMNMSGHRVRQMVGVRMGVIVPYVVIVVAAQSEHWSEWPG